MKKYEAEKYESIDSCGGKEKHTFFVMEILFYFN